MATKVKQYEHELTVEFGGMSAKDNAGIAFAFERNGHTLDDIDAWLCGKRLEVFAVVGTAADQRQQTLPNVDGEPRPHVEATCDVKHFSVKPQKISARLVFSLNEVDVRELSGMAGKSGTLRLNVLGAVESDDDDDPEEEPYRTRQRRLPQRAPVNSATTGSDAGGAMPLSALVSKDGLTKAKVEALAEAFDIKTVADLERVIREDAIWHQKVKGFGEQWIDRTSDAIVAHRKTYPVPSPDDTQSAESPTSVQFPDRNGEGTDISTEGIQSFDADGEGWAVTVYVGKASDSLYRSCLMALVGKDSGGREVPIEESRPYRTVEDAGRAAVDDLITVWAESDMEAKRTLCDPLRRFRDETWPADAAAPADVPFGR